MARPRSATDDSIFAVLSASATPMTAYQVLDKLRPQGVSSPPVVYRALDRLEKSGQIHRLEQLNAYFACHGQHHADASAVFAVCTGCRKVEEWGGAKVDAILAADAASAGFTLTGRTIEVRGLCAQCAAAADAGSEAPGHHHHDGHSHD